MIIWGYRTKILQLAMVTFLCGQCGNPSAHALRKRVTKFTLFFIPLFPISVKHYAECTFCGCVNRLSKEQSAELQAQDTSGQYQQPQQQYGQPQQGPPSRPFPQQPPHQPQHPSQYGQPYPQQPGHPQNPYPQQPH